MSREAIPDPTARLCPTPQAPEGIIAKQPDTHGRIYAAVRRIPRGRVATYGQIARLAGLPGQPRLVGYALHALPRATGVPWHRVINAGGTVSLRRSGGALLQRILLEEEGVEFDARGRVDLVGVQWRPGRQARSPGTAGQRVHAKTRKKRKREEQQERRIAKPGKRRRAKR